MHGNAPLFHMFDLICNSIGSCSTHIATCLRPQIPLSIFNAKFPICFFFWCYRKNFVIKLNPKKYTWNCRIHAVMMASHSINILQIDWHWISNKHLIQFKEKCKQKQKCQNNIISLAAHSVKIRYFRVIFISSASIISIVYEKTAATASHIPSIWLPLYKEKREKKN